MLLLPAPRRACRHCMSLASTDENRNPAVHFIVNYSLLHIVAYCCDLLHWQPAPTAIDELLAQSSEWAGMKLMVFDDVRVRSNGLITAAKLLKNMNSTSNSKPAIES